MCDICVINGVKERMLSRRNLFKNTAAVTATATVGSAAMAPKALAAGHGTVEDLTHLLSDEFPTYFGVPGIKLDQVNNYEEHKFNMFHIDLAEHTGTHMDAPLHFSADGHSVDEVAVGDLVVPLCVIDIASKSESDADAQVTPDDIRAWIDANGDIPDKACVAMHSGWGSKTGGDGFRNADADGVMHFPGFHIEAAQMLMEETGAVGMAVDTLSLDFGKSADFATHYGWLPTNRWGLECVANLDKLPAAGATIVVGAPKIKGGSGGPCRVFAMV